MGLQSYTRAVKNNEAKHSEDIGHLIKFDDTRVMICEGFPRVYPTPSIMGVILTQFEDTEGEIPGGMDKKILFGHMQKAKYW